MRPPLEECEAAGAIRALGASHAVIDAPTLGLSDEELKHRVKDFRPDLLLLTVTFGSLQADLVWARELKRLLPEIPLGLRGAPCYVQAQELLDENPSVDFCIHGDYELIFQSIIEFGLEESPGVTYRKDDNTISKGGPAYAENLDELPLPDRSGIEAQRYTVRGLGHPQATIRVQRGCPFPCTYCLVHTVSGNRARHRSADSIVMEMQQLLRDGIRYFYLRAETFTLNRQWALELCTEIALRCPGVRWVTTTRVELVDEELLIAMKDAGCYGISFGLDAASKEISHRIRKPLRQEEAKQVFALCRRHGMLSLAYLMIGFIWDTDETLDETARFVHNIRPDLLTVHYAHPYPGTEYYRQVLESLGSEVQISPRAQAEPAIAISHLSATHIHKEGRKLLRRHRRRPSVIFSLGKALVRLYVSDKISARP
jgi:anaerobic magnesium-protoporphyrin IX monomethyl ester cyclase